MIVVCPSCATRQEVQENHLIHGKALVRCLACRREWIERTQGQVIEAVACEALPDANPRPEAQNTFHAEREATAPRACGASRRATIPAASGASGRTRCARWLALAAAVLAPVLVMLLLPQQVARAFPPALRLYAIAGLDINLRGLEFRNVGQQHLFADKVRVLAIQGEIVNVSGREQHIPVIQFTLRDWRKAAIYEWSLKPATRPIKAGEVSTFLTRLASPPEAAEAVEIRFAGDREFGHYSLGHDGHHHRRAQDPRLCSRKSRSPDASARLAREIARSKPHRLLAVPILKGSFVFAADLMRACHRAGLSPEVDFLILASYRADTRSSGHVDILRDIETDVKGPRRAAHRRYPGIGPHAGLRQGSPGGARRQAGDDCGAARQGRPTARAAIEADFKGFDCPDKFVVGYGMDMAHAFRELPFVGYLASKRARPKRTVTVTRPGRGKGEAAANSRRHRTDP